MTVSDLHVLPMSVSPGYAIFLCVNRGQIAQWFTQPTENTAQKVKG